MPALAPALILNYSNYFGAISCPSSKLADAKASQLLNVTTAYLNLSVISY